MTFAPALALALAALAAAAAAPPCEYIADIQSVTLPGQAGQPAGIAFTSSDFQTYRRHLGLARDFAQRQQGRRVLDVGAGLSDFVDVLADEHGAEAYAIDVAYGELDLSGLSADCVELFHRRRLPMDATRILFPSNFFDLVVSHGLLRWFFLDEPEAAPGEGSAAATGEARLRIRRGMQILGQMVRVVAPGGEVRTTDFPDPDGRWYAERRPGLADEYRAAYRELLRPYACGDEESGECALDLSFHYDGKGRGWTVIRKLARVPAGDAGGEVSVIRAQRRSRGPVRR